MSLSAVSEIVEPEALAPAESPAVEAAHSDGTGAEGLAAEALDAAGPALVVPLASAIENAIKTGTIAAMATGLAPLPLVGLGGLLAVNLVMLNALARQFGVKMSTNVVKTAILGLLGGVLPISLGIGVAELLKFIPGFGTVTGAAGTSILAGTVTYAIGQAFAEHLRSGGDLMTVDAAALRGHFNDALGRGREMATSLATRAKGVVTRTPAETPAAGN